MTSDKILIIIPTFNEIENIESIIREVHRIKKDAHVLIVDDNSPDGTASKIKELQKTSDKIHLLERASKQGLGTAYIAGFQYAIKNQYDFVFEMDADFSHDPAEINNFLKAAETADLVIGSRYVKGGRIDNWPFVRLMLSACANKYVRWVTRMPVYDATGGFKCFRRKVLEAIDLTQVRAEGYSFQIEMNYKAWKLGFCIKEIPICFCDRMRGKSKMSKKIVWEAIWVVWRLVFSRGA